MPRCQMPALRKLRPLSSILALRTRVRPSSNVLGNELSEHVPLLEERLANQLVARALSP